MRNEYEDYVKSIIKLHGNVQLEHERQSVRSIEVLKQSCDMNKLFTEASSYYCTEIGNQKRTEFVYHSPLNNTDWRIECKSRKKLGLLGEILRELNYVSKIAEKMYCLVLSDVLINQYFLEEIYTTIKEKNISHKVWVGNAEQFKNLLIERIKI